MPISRSASPIFESSRACREQQVCRATGPGLTDAFSIFAAARDATDATALAIGEQRLSFGQIAERVRERLCSLNLDASDGGAYPLTGSNTLETLVTLYALLEARVPALLLHPRQTEAERAAVVDAARRAGSIVPTDAAAVIYTSGTTGEPRGAVLTRAALLASAQASAANLGWQEDDCWLLAMPIARVGGLSILTRCLSARRCVALAPAFDARLLPRWIAQQRVTLVSLVPTMLTQCLEANPDWTPPPRLRAILLGGAEASARLLRRAQERRLPIVITYGCTETCSQVASTPYEKRYEAAKCGAGRPLHGAQLRVADGRIEVRGPMLMAGYLGEPALDSQAWFDTGDLGEIDASGYLHVHARRTDLIVSGGENVYPAEVERVLESCAGVAAAGVFGLPDETWGQTVAAALVADAVAPSEQALGDHIVERLAPHKRPRKFCFVPALPQTNAGKLDRQALVAMAGALRPLRPLRGKEPAMHAPTTAPFGSWKSPITAQQVAAGTRPLSAPQIDGGQVYWLEGLAAQGGRVAVVRAGPDGTSAIMTPAPFNVRSRVHEYGGGALLVAGGTLYFSNFADNLVYRQHGESAPEALTGNSLHRHADFMLDTRRQRLVAVREDHSQTGQEARNSLVAIGLEGGERELAGGFDFYAAPRLAPDGRQLAWLCWNHPLMPWEGTELWLADVAADGGLARARRIAGGPDESLCEPLWSRRGELFVVSDRSGWWNLYRVADETLLALCTMQAEFGRPLWVFGQAMFGFTGDDEIVATFIKQGMSKLLRIDLSGGTQHTIDTPFTDLDELRAGPGFVVAVAGSPTAAQQVVRIDATSGAHQVLARSLDELPEAGDLSLPERISYPSRGGRVAHAFFYPPRNRDFVAPTGELPPLIVMSHGGPTSMASSTLRLSVQYWTSRGFALLDVNYGGSSGFGRAYRNLLKGQWGVVDVDDCVAGAVHLADSDRVDGERMAIRGGSAGGFTTLCALAFHRVFKAGASYYGVSDLKALDEDTHKFESRYNTWLVAPPPERERLYAERSPALHADRLSCPVIFFQGLDDKVVLPAQSELMVEALKARGIPVAYLAFEGEGHGFRRKETIQRTLEAEASFYAQVFGFALADAVEGVANQGEARPVFAFAKKC
jgi:dipeptidyl aminopeptidase/acylaminoacyl peptidase/acyl-CoA synthetase (AMP-forming)/AMP-acid ligase II